MQREQRFRGVTVDMQTFNQLMQSDQYGKFFIVFLFSLLFFTVNEFDKTKKGFEKRNK